MTSEAIKNLRNILKAYVGKSFVSDAMTKSTEKQLDKLLGKSEDGEAYKALRAKLDTQYAKDMRKVMTMTPRSYGDYEIESALTT